MCPLLVADSISKSYVAGFGRCWARVHVLSRLSLILADGERLVIRGGRGSGKTTLLHCLTGLRRPDAGSVRWSARQGAPYRICIAPRDLEGVGRGSSALIELPERSPDAGEWIERLHGRRSDAGGWLAFASRAGPIDEIAHRVLELRDGRLRPVVASKPRQVAESARAVG